MYGRFPIGEAGLVVIRHWATRKVPGLEDAGVPKPVAFAGRHSRLFNQDLQGLTALGGQKAYAHGAAFAREGVNVARFLCGFDQRNVDGACAKREGHIENGGSGPAIVAPHPLITYPVYTLGVAATAEESFGNYTLHRWLGEGLPELDGLMTETREGFVRRGRLLVEDGLDLAQELGGTVVADGNFELIVLLHYLYGVDLADFTLLAALPPQNLFTPELGHCFGFRRNEVGGIEVCRYGEQLEIIDP